MVWQVRISAAALAVFCAICLLGVTSYAADTGLSLAPGGGDDRPDDHPAASASTDTDLSEVLNDEISSMDNPIILLQSGTVVLANDIEDPPRLGSSSSGNQSIGFSIEISSSIGSQLLVPSEYSDKSFSIDSNGNLIGIRSGSFSCYVGEYTVRFPSYGTPQYRLTNGSGYTWNDINIQYISSSNVEVIGSRFNWWSDQVRSLVAIATLCFILILALRRRD